tara:strand:- start:12079 stop:12255 length:177 start_codon:yes stop_codon:yes gene_type:complete
MTIGHVIIWIVLLILFGPVVWRMGLITVTMTLVWLFALAGLVVERVYNIVGYICGWDN